MSKLETKDMILYAYRIENEELSSAVSDFTANLFKKLESDQEVANKLKRAFRRESGTAQWSLTRPSGWII